MCLQSQGRIVQCAYSTQDSMMKARDYRDPQTFASCPGSKNLTWLCGGDCRYV